MSPNPSGQNFLSDNEREYLEGNIEEKSNIESTIRGQLRLRLIGALKDFQLINAGIEDRDIEQIQESFSEEELQQALNSVITFGCMFANSDERLEMTRVIREGIKNATEDREQHLLERFENNDPTLSWVDIEFLNEMGHIDAEDRQEYHEKVRSRFEEFDFGPIQNEEILRIVTTLTINESVADFETGRVDETGEPSVELKISLAEEVESEEDARLSIINEIKQNTGIRADITTVDDF